MHIHTYGYLVDVKKIILVFGLNIDKKKKKKEGKKKNLIQVWLFNVWTTALKKTLLYLMFISPYPTQH